MDPPASSASPGQDPNPAGLGTGTVLSIILALVLLAVLLVMCGPLVYKKLVKKCRCRRPNHLPFHPLWGDEEGSCFCFATQPHPSPAHWPFSAQSNRNRKSGTL